MWFSLLTILGGWVAGILSGFLVYLIVAKKKTTVPKNQPSFTSSERPAPLTITENIDDQSLQQPPGETDDTKEKQRETDTGTEDIDWLNSGVTEASESTLKKEAEDWLNAGMEEVPANVQKQTDDDWHKSEDNELSETPDGNSFDQITAKRPEIQITQDGSVLNVMVTASAKQEPGSEPLKFNLKINLPPQDLATKGDGPYDIEITTDDSVPSNQSLQDNIEVKPVEEPTDQSRQLLDDLSIRPAESAVAESHTLMDEITVKSFENPVLPDHQPLDELSVKPAENVVAENHVLADEITVKPAESPVFVGHQSLDEISIRPAENAVAVSYFLIDEITIRPVESPDMVNSRLHDEISVRPVENAVTERHALMDEITVKPSPGPIKLEYELLDDLITKDAARRARKVAPTSEKVTASPEGTIETAAPSGEAGTAGQVTVSPATTNPIITSPVESPVAKTVPSVDTFTTSPATTNPIITSPVESPVAKTVPSVDTFTTSPATTNPITANLEGSPTEKATPVKPITVDEIAAVLDEKTAFKQATTPSIHTESPGSLKRALATLRIYNTDEFYIQDTDLSDADTLAQEPQIKAFTFKVLRTVTELDELIEEDYDLVINFGKIKRGLEKGMVVFLILIGRELASIGWACVTEESKATFKGYPYNDDLDGQSCIVGDWTNPKFRKSGASIYIRYKRQQLLKGLGFTIERSVIDESIAKDLYLVKAQKKHELNYKLRTYTNVSLPGILWIEIWKEHALNETDHKPPYFMVILNVFGLQNPLTVSI